MSISICYDRLKRPIGYYVTDCTKSFDFMLMNPERYIKEVIFNDPATVVLWKDGTKTVVKSSNEKFDPEKGLAMAFAKKMFGNKGNYYNVFKRFLSKYGGGKNNEQ